MSAWQKFWSSLLGFTAFGTLACDQRPDDRALRPSPTPLSHQAWVRITEDTEVSDERHVPFTLHTGTRVQLVKETKHGWAISYDGHVYLIDYDNGELEK